MAGQLYGLRSRLHRPGGKNSAASRQRFWPKSVTYVAGTFCHLCVRSGPWRSGHTPVICTSNSSYRTTARRTSTAGPRLSRPPHFLSRRPPKHMLSSLFFGVLSLSFIFRSVCCATKRDGIPRSPMNPEHSEASIWSEAREIHHVLAPRAIGISSATWPFRWFRAAKLSGFDTAT